MNILRSGDKLNGKILGSDIRRLFLSNIDNYYRHSLERSGGESDGNRPRGYLRIKIGSNIVTGDVIWLGNRLGWKTVDNTKVYPIKSLVGVLFGLPMIKSVE